MSDEGLIRTLRAMAARPVTTDALLDAIAEAHANRAMPLREFAVHHIAAAFRVDYLVAAYVAAARRFEGDRPWSAPARLDEMTALITEPFRDETAPALRREPKALGVVRKVFGNRAPRSVILQPGPQGFELADALPVNARSVQYAMCAGTGGVLVDDWLRVLGGGNGSVRANLAAWNGLGPSPEFAPIKRATLVAFDVLGGLYAVDHGAFKRHSLHEVYYFSPATLAWASTGRTYAGLLDWTQLVSVFDEAHAALRWEGWRDEARRCAFDEALEALDPLAPERARRVVSATERVLANFEAARARDGAAILAPARP